MNYEKELLRIIDNEYDKMIEIIQNKLNLLKTKRLYLFGAGAIGNMIGSALIKNNVKYIGFFDNNEALWGKYIDASNTKECISPSKLSDMRDVTILITSTRKLEIEEQIRKINNNIEIFDLDMDILCFASVVNSDLLSISKYEIKEKLKFLFDIVTDELSRRIIFFRVNALFCTSDEIKEYNYDEIFSDNEYFPEEIKKRNSHDIIVDCGAYIGDTVEFFINKDIKFHRIIAFEMDEINCKIMEKNISDLRKDSVGAVEIRNIGVGNETKEVVYYSKDYSSYVIETNVCGKEVKGENIICGKIDTLDNQLKGLPVTFLKMDIEGYEIKALEGAKELISKQKPLCAICVYHLTTDLWDIPLYLYELNNSYKFIIRHHSRHFFDTVCYAIP